MFNASLLYQCISVYEKALETYRQTEDKYGEERPCRTSVQLNHNLADYGRAVELHKEHLKIARDIDDRGAFGPHLEICQFKIVGKQHGHREPHTNGYIFDGLYEKAFLAGVDNNPSNCTAITLAPIFEG